MGSWKEELFTTACFQSFLPIAPSPPLRVKCNLTTAAELHFFPVHFTDDKIEQQMVKKICPKVSRAEPRGKIKLDENPGKVKQGQKQWDSEINSGYSFGCRVKNERV